MCLDAKTGKSIYRERVMERAGGNLVITIDTSEKCLWIYPLPEWEPIEKKLTGLSGFNPQIRALQRLQLRRQRFVRDVGQPEDVAHLVRFLISDESEWINGQVYSVDGGTLFRL